VSFVIPAFCEPLKLLFTLRASLICIVAGAVSVFPAHADTTNAAPVITNPNTCAIIGKRHSIEVVFSNAHIPLTTFVKDNHLYLAFPGDVLFHDATQNKERLSTKVAPIWYDKTSHFQSEDGAGQLVKVPLPKGVGLSGRLQKNKGYAVAISYRPRKKTFPLLKEPESIKLRMDLAKKQAQLKGRFDVAFKIHDTHTDEAWVFLPTAAKLGVNEFQDKYDFVLHPTLQGVALEARSPDLSFQIHDTHVAFSTPSGLSLSSANDYNVGLTHHSVPDTPLWTTSPPPIWELRQRVAKTHNPIQKSRLMLEHAKALLVHNSIAEALAVLSQIASQNYHAAQLAEYQSLQGVAFFLKQHLTQAFYILSNYRTDRDIQPFLAIIKLCSGQSGADKEVIQSVKHTIQIPDTIEGNFLLTGLKYSIDHGLDAASNALIQKLDSLVLTQAQKAYLETLKRFKNSPSRISRAGNGMFGGKARSAFWDAHQTYLQGTLDKLVAQHNAQDISTPYFVTKLQLLSQQGRGADLEFNVLSELLHIYEKTRNIRGALKVHKRLTSYFGQSPQYKALHGRAERAYLKAVYHPNLSDLELLSLFQEFSDFLPQGSRGEAVLAHAAHLCTRHNLPEYALKILSHNWDTIALQPSLSVETARAFNAMGQHEQALKTLIEFDCSKTPYRHAWLEQKAIAFLGLEQYEDALHIVDEEEDNLPLLLSIYERTGQWSDALATLEKKIAQNPKNPQLIDICARILYHQEQTDKIALLAERHGVSLPPFAQALHISSKLRTPEMLNELSQHIASVRTFISNVRGSL
jgi:tetratricopeptide (TPR) repeat protein